MTESLLRLQPETKPEAYPGLHPALRRLAELQREAIDVVALQDAVDNLPAALAPAQVVARLLRHLDADPAALLGAPDAAQLPLLACSPDGIWGVLMTRDAQGRWLVLQRDAAGQRWLEQTHSQLDGWLLAKARLRRPFQARKSPVLAMVLGEISQHRGLLLEAAVGGLLIGALGLVSSFYSMQIYDRVIPSNAMQTLLVLSLGVFMTIVLEWLARAARSRLYERLIDAVDARLARAVYLRLLAVRLDQLPPSVGSLAAQTRGYETVRGFLTQMTGSLLVDLPFTLLFLALLALIGGPLMLVPLLFFVGAVAIAMSASGRLSESAKAGASAGFFKTGLLVETVEGAETLKSGQGGWRMLGRWLSVTGRARDAEQAGRRVSEHFQHAMQAFQQLCYALLIALGAWRVGQGEMSMGALVACSILAGRVLSPVSTLVGQLLQWSHARAALQALDSLWQMEDDHAGQEPVVLERLGGHYSFDQVRFSHGQRTALSVPKLAIRAGERIGVVGPIGSGKTTLLRLLSGLYKPQEGRVLLDDVDLALLSKPVLADHMGYLQQEGRLFAGSLRENLLLGLVDPGDAAVLDAARRSGLLTAVIAPHPQGLQQPIHEGGAGLSGGQRQLVNFTRVLLRQPSIWLLDEPTASLDGQTERQVVQLLAEAVRPEHTLVLVTHKPELLRLVDRLIVVADQKVLLDGPVQQVLARLQTPEAAVPLRAA